MTFSVEPRHNKDMKWLAVDLDGTLAEPVWPDPGIGAPIIANLDKVDAAVRAGWKIIIHTSRPWTDYEMIESWCEQVRIPARRIVCGKVLAAAYIDDRAIRADESSWIPTEVAK